MYRFQKGAAQAAEAVAAAGDEGGAGVETQVWQPRHIRMGLEPVSAGGRRPQEHAQDGCANPSNSRTLWAPGNRRSLFPLMYALSPSDTSTHMEASAPLGPAKTREKGAMDFVVWRACAPFTAAHPRERPQLQQGRLTLLFPFQERGRGRL